MHTLISITKRNVSPVRMFSQWYLDQLFKVPFIHHWAPRGHDFFPTNWSLMTCPGPNSAASCYFILYKRCKGTICKCEILHLQRGNFSKLFCFMIDKSAIETMTLCLMQEAYSNWLLIKNQKQLSKHTIIRKRHMINLL